MKHNKFFNYYMAALLAVGVINLVMGVMDGDQTAMQVGSVAVAMFAIYVIFNFSDELAALVKPLKRGNPRK
jgi:uncharacterized membrane protein YhaH (DUF805 family)